VRCLFTPPNRWTPNTIQVCNVHKQQRTWDVLHVWITTAVYTGNIAGSILITEQIEEEKTFKKNYTGPGESLRALTAFRSILSFSQSRYFGLSFAIPAVKLHRVQYRGSQRMHSDVKTYNQSSVNSAKKVIVPVCL